MSAKFSSPGKSFSRVQATNSCQLMPLPTEMALATESALTMSIPEIFISKVAPESTCGKITLLPPPSTCQANFFSAICCITSGIWSAAVISYASSAVAANPKVLRSLRSRFELDFGVCGAMEVEFMPQSYSNVRPVHR